MKTMSVVFAAILMAAPVFAAERGTAEYQRLVELKKAQRAAKEAEKANPSSKEKTFWQKEAERSGLAGTAAMFTNAIGNAVPLDKPKDR